MSFFSRSIFDPPTRLERILATPLQYLISSLYRIFNWVHSAPPRPKQPAIRVVCISDTHSLQYKPIPDGDLLIHAGDMTRRGTIQELQEHIDWLVSLPHKHKVVIAGNHDTYLDPQSRTTLNAEQQSGQLNWKGVKYLQHSGVTLEFEKPTGQKRSLKVYGAPQIPECGGSDFAFQYERSQDAWTDTVPNNIDVLITHTPPKYHLDLYHPSLGCEHLLREVRRVKPKLHVFGHVHSAAGRETVWWDDVQSVYEDGISKKASGFVRQALDLSLWLDLFKVTFNGLSGLVWDRIWGGEQAPTVMINAALMYRNTGVLRNKPQVVYV
jgi:predicted phosphohydrolase